MYLAKNHFPAIIRQGSICLVTTMEHKAHYLNEQNHQKLDSDRS